MDNYKAICPTQSLEVILYDEYSESSKYNFHFVFLYNNMNIEQLLKEENRDIDKARVNHLLTANITHIDDHGLVTVMFNHKIENKIFNITRT